MSVARSPPPPSQNAEKSLSVPDVSGVGIEETRNTLRNKRKKMDDDESIISPTNLEIITNKIKEDMKEFFHEMVQKQSVKLNSLLSTVKNIETTSTNVESTVAFLAEENSDLKKKIEELIKQSNQDKEQISILENKIEEYQRMDRKTNIEIRNVPLCGGETKQSILGMITKLAENIEIKLDKKEIKDIIKINKNSKEKSTIIVEFTNTYKDRHHESS